MQAEPQNGGPSPEQVMISRKLSSGRMPAVGSDQGALAAPPEAPGGPRGPLPCEANFLLRGCSPSCTAKEDLLLFQEVAAEVFQLLQEEDQLEKRLGQDTGPSWPTTRWATLSMRLLAATQQFSLREGKCLLSISRKESFSLAEEQLVEYIFLRNTAWVSTFPDLKRRCAQMLAQRLENLPAKAARPFRTKPSLGAGTPALSSSRRLRSHQDGVVTSSRLYSRRSLEVPLGSARTQELPPLQMDPAVRSFYIHSADALPPPPGLGGLEDEDDDDDD